MIYSPFPTFFMTISLYDFLYNFLSDLLPLNDSLPLSMTYSRSLRLPRPLHYLLSLFL